MSLHPLPHGSLLCIATGTREDLLLQRVPDNGRKFEDIRRFKISAGGILFYLNSFVDNGGVTENNKLLIFKHYSVFLNNRLEKE